jgi:16S rRNA (guanine527-N7)-methyltransferase
MSADAQGDEAGRIDTEAAAMFGVALPQVRTYARLLTEVGTERGIVGPGEAARIWDRHLLNCGVISRLVPARCSVADLGSGAGLPGIVLSILLPDARVTLVEPLARRVAFLRECVAALDLPNAEVVRGRAEELAGKLAADVVTSRAVAPLDKLAGWSAGLARAGGRVLAMKGESATMELARARVALARLGVSDARVEVAKSSSGAISATVVIFTIPAHRSGGRTVVPFSGSSSVPSVAVRPQAHGGATGGKHGRPSSRRAGG